MKISYTNNGSNINIQAVGATVNGLAYWSLRVEKKQPIVTITIGKCMQSNFLPTQPDIVDLQNRVTVLENEPHIRFYTLDPLP